MIPILFLSLSILDADVTKYDGKHMVLEGKVRLEHPQGQISCDQAVIDLLDEAADLKGMVKLSLPDGGFLECLEASVEMKKNVVTFFPKATYADTKGMKITADEIKVFWKPDKNIQKIIAKGNVSIAKNDEWVIFSSKAELEPDCKILFLERGDEQLSLFHKRGQVFADRAELHLDSKICYLEGGVRLSNQLGQMALSEKVSISKDEVHFDSKPGGHALFYDQLNKMQVSAVAIVVKKDPVTKKDTVKGTGDVRFHFSVEEFDKIKKFLSLEKKP